MPRLRKNWPVSSLTMACSDSDMVPPHIATRSR